MNRRENEQAAAYQEEIKEDSEDTQNKPSDNQDVSSKFKVMINIGMIVAGSLMTIFGKIIDQKVELPRAGPTGEITMVETEFRHPLIMNLLMFSGESILLLALALQLSRDPVAANRHQKNKVSPLVFMAPALLDTLGSFCNFTGLMLISASTYQIMRMLCMVFVVILSVTVLQKKYSVLQYMSVVMVIAGLLAVTMVDLGNTSEI